MLKLPSCTALLGRTVLLSCSLVAFASFAQSATDIQASSLSPSASIAATLNANAAQSSLSGTLHKEPWCGCCTAYADYLEEHGIHVERVDHNDITPLKQRLGTDQAESCHTVELNGYVIEGHVPIAAIQKLLDEKPEIKGIAVPGMPFNSPGMGPEIPGTLPVLSLDEQGKVMGEFGRF